MDDLAKLLRPKRYSEVIGQLKIKAWLTTSGLTRPPQPLLLSGTSGSGKSTLRRIYEFALLCRQPTAQGEFCGRCNACVAHSKHENVDYFHHRSGERSKVDEVLGSLEFLSHTPFISARKILVIEEAGILSDRSAKAFLELVEDLPVWAALIFVTNEPENLPAALRDRFKEHETEPLNSGEAIDYLSSVCAKLKLPYERDALSLIHGESNHSVRKMLRYVEALQAVGAAREDEVRRVLRLDGLSSLEKYIAALCEGNLDRQMTAIESWNDTPARKLELIHRALVDGYFALQRHQKTSDRSVCTVTKKVGPKLQCYLEACAAEMRVNTSDIWSSIISTAEPKKDLYAAQLRMRISAIDDLLRRPSRSIKPAQPKSGSARRKICQPKGTSKYLGWRQFCATWNAASLLPMQYGVLINLRVSIAHIGTNPADHRLGTSLLSNLTRQLDMRISDWAGGASDRDRSFHWLYHHEAKENGELVTRLALSVPQVCLTDGVQWLTKFFSKARWRDTIHDFQLSFRRQEDLRFHWNSIVGLTRTLDPRISLRTMSNASHAVVDLIGLNPRLHAPLGKVYCPQVRGNSETLGPAVRRKADGELPIISALHDQAWDYLRSGWELFEYLDRKTEIERREKLRQAIYTRFPKSDMASQLRRAEEIEVLERSFRIKREISRSWQPWWLNA